jgi:two-component system LytT family response regulator
MRVLLIDDERLARRELKSLLKEFAQIEVVGECSNVDEAKEQIDKLKPDLIFLDIEMPEKSGFDLINELESVPNFVFITAYDEYAIRAFEVNALDYLLKPVDPERLAETIKKIENPEPLNTEEKEENTGVLKAKDQIFLKDGDKCWFVTLEDIRVFESDGNYVKVYFQNSRPLILKSLNSLEKRLDPKLFFRANRKFIINLKCIEGIESWFNGGLQVDIQNFGKVEISRRQAARFKDLMSL